MTKTTRFRVPSKILFPALLWAASVMATAAPMEVLAPVVDVRGSASWVREGSAKAADLKAGDSLAEGSQVHTGANGRVLFSPVPGIAVSEAEDTSASLQRTGITKNGIEVQQRDARLNLATGTLSFSLEKRHASTTTFGVETPSGTMNARGSVGTVTVVPPCVKVVSLSGAVTFTPRPGTGTQVTHVTQSTGTSGFVSPSSPAISSGVPIVIPPGCLLTVCGSGDSVEICLMAAIQMAPAEPAVLRAVAQQLPECYLSLSVPSNFSVCGSPEETA